MFMEQLMDRLEEVFSPRKKPDMEELKKALSDLKGLLKLVPDYCTEPNKLPYGRNVLLRNEEYEIIVIYLPGNQATAIHDHGDSIGCTFVVQGEFLNKTYKLDPYRFPVQQDEYLVQAGDMLEVPYGQIHEMKNLRKDAMISLHVYSPPLHNIKAYTPFAEVLDYVI
jgi:cysteine dioxygenase